MGKRIANLTKDLDLIKAYPLEEGVVLVKKCATAKFDETVELHVRLGVDPKQADQQVRGTVGLPHGLGKSKKVAVVTQGEKQKDATAAGADSVGGAELVDQISKGFLDFEILGATPDMMKDLAKLGKILGPRGLMPNPKSGTVTMDTAKTIKEVKAGKIEFKMDKQAGIHAPLGKLSFTEEALLVNATALIDAIMTTTPQGGSPTAQHVKTLFISTTMGPGVKLDLAQFRKG